MRFNSKIMCAVFSTLLLFSLVSCSIKPINNDKNNEQTSNERDLLYKNENRQFENNYTSNNPLDKSDVP